MSDDGVTQDAVDPQMIETPVGYVDLDRVAANAAAVCSYAAEHSLGWRPHIKTHKSRHIARMQLDAGARGLTVATLREAEVMSTLTDDILLAYPPVGAHKLRRLTRISRTVDLKVGLDSEDVLVPLATALSEAGRSAGVLVELDVGMGRVGVQAAAEVVGLARRAHDLPGVDFRGLLFYPGHIRMSEAKQSDDLAAVTVQLAEVLSALDSAGLYPQIVSGGSTPTLRRSHEMDGLTEIRSGSCIFNDREAVDIGVADLGQVAYTVLATVVSTAVPGQAVVDAGSKALAQESRASGDGFGVLLDHPDVVVSSVSEEHGVLDLEDSEWRPRVGDRVRIMPNHVCVSVNLQDHLLYKDGDAHGLLTLEGRGRTPWTP